jgi:hypothetical protein
LQAGRSYESVKRLPNPELAARVRELDRGSFQQLAPALEGASQVILEERLSSRLLVDSDVIEVFKSLRATMKTLSSGIYYESLPDGPVRQSLYRRLKSYLDLLMQPQTNSGQNALKVSEIIDMLDFLMLSSELHAGQRPRSRQYLDFLARASGTAIQAEQSSRLILP